MRSEKRKKDEDELENSTSIVEHSMDASIKGIGKKLKIKS